jgi:DNA repair protein RadC
MKPYPEQREQIFFGGFEAVKKRRKKVCTSRRYKYSWMRIDPCVELPDIDEEDVPSIQCSRDAVQFFHDSVPFAGRPGEHFMIMCVNTHNQPMAVAVPAIGGRNKAAIDRTIVLQAVILSGATAFIVAHNHPSNSPTPSREDVVFSKELKEGAKLVGLQMLDSMVLTDDPDQYFSLLDAGLLV